MVRRVVGSLMVCGVLVLGAGACSDDGGDSAAALSAILQEEEGMDKATADCLSKEVVKAVGNDAVKKAVAAGGDDGEQLLNEAMEKLSPEKQAEADSAMGNCMPDDLGDLVEEEMQFEEVGNSISEG